MIERLFYSLTVYFISQKKSSLTPKLQSKYFTKPNKLNNYILWGFLQANLSLFLHHHHLKTSLSVLRLPFMVKDNECFPSSNPKLLQTHKRKFWNFERGKHWSFILVLFGWILLYILNNGLRAFEHSWDQIAQGPQGMGDFFFYIQDNGDLRKLPNNSHHNHHWEKTVS